MPFKFNPLNLCKLQRDSRKQSKASLLAKYCYFTKCGSLISKCPNFKYVGLFKSSNTLY